MSYSTAMQNHTKSYTNKYDDSISKFVTNWSSIPPTDDFASPGLNLTLPINSFELLPYTNVIIKSRTKAIYQPKACTRLQQQN